MLKMQMIGHLGKDAVVKEVNGKKVVNFSIAHTEKYKVSDVLHERTTWVSCGMWESTKVAEYLKKGTQVYVEGAPSVNTWVDTDGVLKGDLKLNVFRLELLGSAKKESTATGTEQTTPGETISQTVTSSPSTNDDLPF